MFRALKLFCLILYQWRHVIINLPKPIRMYNGKSGPVTAGRPSVTGGSGTLAVSKEKNFLRPMWENRDLCYGLLMMYN